MEIAADTFIRRALQHIPDKQTDRVSELQEIRRGIVPAVLRSKSDDEKESDGNESTLAKWVNRMLFTTASNELDRLKQHCVATTT